MGQGRSLVERARDGDELAWREIATLVGPPVLAYARSKGVRDPEDILSETLIGLLKAIKRFKGPESGLRALAVKIARNRVADHYRKIGRSPQLQHDSVDEVDPADPVDATQDLVNSAQVVRILEQLPELQREVLVMRIALGLSAEEIGEIIGKRPGAVRVMVHRTLKKVNEMAEAVADV